MNQTDVIVAGAGPVGLSLALALARQGASVEVFEAAPALSDEARASTLHPATLEMLDEWGVAEQVLSCGAKVDRLQYWERATRQLVAEFPYELIARDTAFPFRLQCPQSDLTPILLSALEKTGRARVHFSHQVVGVDQSDDTASITVASTAERTGESGGGERTFSARFVCAADGARSAARRSLGLSFDGTTYEDRFLLVGTDLEPQRWFPEFGPVGYIFDPDEWVIFMRLPTLVRVVFRLAPEEVAEEALVESAVRARVHAFLGEAPDFRIFMKSIYRVHQRVADRFRVGRIALLGDAAHVNNPAGGMGLNSGIHDAHKLAPVLIDFLQSGNGAGLDEWAAARREAALSEVQRAAAKNYDRLVVRDPARQRERNDDLARRAADPALARNYLLEASMLARPA